MSPLHYEVQDGTRRGLPWCGADVDAEDLGEPYALAGCVDDVTCRLCRQHVDELEGARTGHMPLRALDWFGEGP
jgi:hypothetical protein